MTAEAAAIVSQAEWVERARLGDRAAFEHLYRAHCGCVYGLCLRLTREAAVAEDCTQETFISAWRNLARFEGRSALGTWLHRIAVNVALARGRRTHLEVVPPPEDVDRAESPGSVIDDDTPPIDVENARMRSLRFPKARATCWCSTASTVTPMRKRRTCSASRSAPAKRSCIVRAACCASA